MRRFYIKQRNLDWTLLELRKMTLRYFIMFKLFINIITYSFHCGHNNKETMLYDDSMHYASEVFQVAKQLGFNPNVIDIGGGFLEHSELGLSLKMV